MDFFILIFTLIIFLFSVMIHEVSHGAAANALGDPTAKYAGRLSLNPIKHLDPIGSILLPGFLLLMNFLSKGGFGLIFGWAKPVPYNPYNLHDQKYGRAKVGAAGPLSNLLMAIFFGIPLRFFPQTESVFVENMGMFFTYVVWINLILFVFNLWPGAPFDGHHILFSFFPSLERKFYFLQNSMMSTIFALFFMSSIGFSIICPVLFMLITGISI